MDQLPLPAVLLDQVQIPLNQLIHKLRKRSGCRAWAWLQPLEMSMDYHLSAAIGFQPLHCRSLSTELTLIV